MAILSNVNGKFAVESTGAIQFNGSNGTSGYVLMSNGNASPTWVDPDTIIGPYLPLAGGTLTGATATASGISFTVGGVLTGTSATFTENIATAADKRISVGTWDNSAFTGGNAYGFSVTSSLPLLHLTESDETNKKGYVGLSGGSMYVGGLISNLYLQSGASGTTALTIDSSQNATFAGSIASSGNITATTSGTTTVNSVSTGDWAGMKIQSSDAASAYLFFNDTSAERARIQSTANNDLKFSTNGGGSLALTLDSSTNATFAGTVTATGNITTDGIFINETAPDNNVFEAIQSGRKMALYTYFSSNATDSQWILRTSTGATDGATTDALIVKPGSATFAGTISGSGIELSNYMQIKVDDAEIYWTNTANNDYWRWKRDASNNFICDHYNGSSTTAALSFDSSQNATFAGDVQAAGIYVGSTNTSFDFYNNGTSYFNGLSTFDDNIKVPSASHFIHMGDGLSTTSNIRFGSTSWNNSLGLESFWMVLRTNRNEGVKFIDSDGYTYAQFNASNNSAGAYNTTFSGKILTPASGTIIEAGGADAFGYNATSGRGFYIRGTGSTYIYGGGKFYTGGAAYDLLYNTQTADATFGGNVGIRENSPTASLHIGPGGTSQVGIKVQGNSSSTVENILSYNSQAHGTGWYHLVGQYYSGGYANAIIIYGNGNVQNLNNSYGQVSDERLKENITDATPKLEDIKKLKVKNFNFKGDDLKQIGMIAQEVEEVFPGLVEEVTDPKTKEKSKSLKYSVFVPMLIKSIQELEARVKELENK